MEKIRFATNYKINIVKKFPFSMKNQYCRNIAIFKIFCQKFGIN